MDKGGSEMILPNTEEARAEAESAITTTNQVQMLIDDFEVKTDKDIKTAAQWITELKDAKTEIETKRKSFVGPLNKVIKELNAFFKPAIDSLDKMERHLRTAITDSVETRLKRRDTLLSSVATQPTTEGKNAIIKEAATITPDKIAGVSIRETWVAEITDEKAIKEWAVENGRLDLLTVNQSIFDQLAKDHHCEGGIPGWIAKKKNIVAVTAKKLK
jgi:hypothetical protein